MQVLAIISAVSGWIRQNNGNSNAGNAVSHSAVTLCHHPRFDAVWDNFSRVPLLTNQCRPLLLDRRKAAPFVVPADARPLGKRFLPAFMADGSMSTPMLRELTRMVFFCLSPPNSFVTRSTNDNLVVNLCTLLAEVFFNCLAPGTVDDILGSFPLKKP